MSTDPVSTDAVGDPATILSGDNPPAAPDPSTLPTIDSSDDDNSPPSTSGLLEALTARGIDVSKYQSEEDALDGVASGLRMIGKRASHDREREQILRAIQEKFGEDAVYSLASGKLPETSDGEPKPSKSAVDKVPNSQIDLWRAQHAAGELSDLEVQRWRQRTREIEHAANMLANGELSEPVQDYVMELVNKRLEDYSQETVRESSEKQWKASEEKKLSSFYADHGNKIFVNSALGDEGGRTAFGDNLLNEYLQNPALQSTPFGADRLQLAYNLIAAQTSSPAKTSLKPSRAAKHEPATTGAPKTMSPEEYWKQNPGATSGDYFMYFADMEQQNQ